MTTSRSMRFIAECMGEIENDKVGYAQKED